MLAANGYPCMPQQSPLPPPPRAARVPGLQVALELSQLQKFTGRERPTVIT